MSYNCISTWDEAAYKTNETIVQISDRQSLYLILQIYQS